MCACAGPALAPCGRHTVTPWRPGVLASCRQDDVCGR
jgi:hypothetical protein